MSDVKKKKKKTPRPSSEAARGFRDLFGEYLHKRQKATQIIADIYKEYGYHYIETPIIETADALGKFLPDVDRPAGGVFGFQDDDEQWLALRYDLTAPLARFMARHEQSLPKPFKRYQMGSVFRNEKPGPGRFREFFQCDADVVGSANLACEAELCTMIEKILRALDISQDDFIINLSHRKFLFALMEEIGLSSEETTEQQGIVLRAIDKMDRLGEEGVRALLGEGRKDESGDFTKGAHLTKDQTDLILSFVTAKQSNNMETIKCLKALMGHLPIAQEALQDIEIILSLLSSLNPDHNIIFNPAIVRGLGYYTGAIFEAELTFPVKNDKGESVQFGSIAGGGRYDNLVARFTGRTIPAVGVSIGIDRLLSALDQRDKISTEQFPVVITIMDKDRIGDYMQMAALLRKHNIAADVYLGEAGFKAQMKYADKRNAPIAIIQGSQEKENGTVILKDLYLGREIAQTIDSNEEWKNNKDVQKEIPEQDLIQEINKMLN